VITEAIHLLPRQDQRELLWELILRGGIEIVPIEPPDIKRIHDLMAKYADVPMDLADASLVAVGERLRLRSVFTLDSHFRIYRPRHTRRFEVFP
jgi:predicted nucleic acid-binding protein